MVRAQKCPYCGGVEEEKTGRTPVHGVEYRYWHCRKCGEEDLDMGQLHEVAERERAMRRYHAKLSRWGASIAIRIPKALLKKYKLKAGKEVVLIPEEGAIRVVG